MLEAQVREVEFRRLGDALVDDLRQAAAMGYRNPQQYRFEPALAPLRARGLPATHDGSGVAVGGVRLVSGDWPVSNRSVPPRAISAC